MPALATRCPDCGTSFRVQESQLAASQGFVRCGRCDAVFDARQSLFDLNDGQPVNLPSDTPAAPATASTAVAAPTPMAANSPAAEPPPWDVPAPADEAASAAPTESPSEFPSTRPTSPAEPAWIDGGTAPGPDRPEPEWRDPAWSDASAARDGFDDSLPPEAVNERMRALLGGPAGAPAADNPAAAWASLAATPPPGTRKRRLEGVTWLGVAVLALALPLQWAWTERAALRAQLPGLDHVWRQACPGCDAPAWKQLDGLSVGASSLQPTPQDRAYHLQLTLHNRSAHPLAMPWLDLRLQDAQGRVLLRRAVSPQELGGTSDRLPAGAQIPLQGTFRLKPAAASNLGTVSGYEIGLFHP